MLNLHVKIAKFGWGGMPPDPATTVWFVTFFNPYEFAGMLNTWCQDQTMTTERKQAVQYSKFIW